MVAETHLRSHTSRMAFLKVKTEDVEFAVSGDPAFVESAYDAVQNLILERFVDATNAPNIELAEETEVEEIDELCHINLTVCNEVYGKVYLVRCEELQTLLFGNTIDFEGIQRIYIDRDLQPEVEKKITLGKVLWRELTTAGRAAIRNAK